MSGDPINIRKRPPERIFGLSLDRTVEWATALTDGTAGVNYDTIEKGTFQNVTLAPPRKVDFDLQEELAAALEGLKDDPYFREKRIFEECGAVGVSTIGVVDPTNKRLIRIIMKELFPEAKGSVSKRVTDLKKRYLVDFKELFGNQLHIETNLADSDRLSVRNDTTAAAVAEYFGQCEYSRKHHEGAELTKVVYLKFDEGVNGGIIVGPRPFEGRPVETERNVELGHSYPRLHWQDRDFRGVCPVHRTCYEGLASNRRLRESWGGKTPRADFTLVDLPENHPAWEIMAHYIAHLSYTALLVASPERIILGGSVISGRDEASRRKVHDHLFPRIWGNFERLIGDSLLSTFLPPHEPAENFIQSGLVNEYTSLTGALLIAADSTKYAPRAVRKQKEGVT